MCTVHLHFWGGGGGGEKKYFVKKINKRKKRSGMPFLRLRGGRGWGRSIKILYESNINRNITIFEINTKE